MPGTVLRRKNTSAATSPIEPPAPSVEPRAISIPALDIDQRTVELAVNGTELQVPTDYDDIGWWRDGPVPGQRGAAVLVGHVDSPTDRAVFYHLSGMRPGQKIVTRLDDGSRRVFEVQKVTTYPRDGVPTERVYRTDGRPGLRLLTCGGSFDRETGTYERNVVVFAELVKSRPGTQEGRT